EGAAEAVGDAAADGQTVAGEQAAAQAAGAANGLVVGELGAAEGGVGQIAIRQDRTADAAATAAPAVGLVARERTVGGREGSDRGIVPKSRRRAIALDKDGAAEAGAAVAGAAVPADGPIVREGAA